MPFTLTMPKLSPTMDEGSIARWHVEEGEYVEVDQLVMEVATDKATVEYAAIDPGYVRKILVPEGGEAKVNDPLAIMSEDKDESIEGYGEASTATNVEETPAEALEVPRIEVSQQESNRVLASPLARVLAKEKGINLATVAGSGPRGRVMSRDLEEQVSVESGTFHEESLSQMRKVIAKRLQQAKRDIPHFYVKQVVDGSLLSRTRQQLKEEGFGFTINDFVIRACALALKGHPGVNSGFNEAGPSIIRFETVDISIAVDVEGGLITPIITHTDRKSVSEISQEVKVLVKKAKEGKLQPHEFQGGSFTLSNLGMFGTTEFSAIINPPQGAILAVGALFEGKMILTLSVDHRVIDGAMAALFLKDVKKYLESPALLLV